jgi:hypothetical protein
MDLLRHWAKHYMEYRFDSYRIYLHTRHDMDHASRSCFVDEMKRFYNFDATFIPDTPEFKCGSLRQKVIDGYRKTLPENDYLVVADSDEFHDIPKDDYREMILSHDAVTGSLVDRWSDTLSYCRQNIPPFGQYPREGNFLDEFDPPLEFAPVFTKVLSSRANIPVSFIGSHFISPSYAKKHEGDLEIMNGRKVLHFTYRDSFIRRMCERPYYRYDDVMRICRYFRVPSSTMEWVQKVFDRRQQEMGWIPSRKD